MIRHILPWDYEQIKKYVTSSNVSKFLTWAPYDNEEDIKVYFNKILKATHFPDETLWIIHGNLLIGTIHIISRWKKNIQFWFWILPEYWWQWIGAMSVIKAIEYIRESIWTWYTIWWDVHHLNRYGIDCLVKSWFHFEKVEIELNRNRYSFII